MPRRILDHLAEMYALAFRLEGPGGADDLAWEAASAVVAGPARGGGGIPRAAAFRAVRERHLARVEAGRAVAFPRVPPRSAGLPPAQVEARRVPREWALADLEEVDRTALLLREVWGLPYEEVAWVLGEDAAATRSRLRRVRAEFARLLDELAPEELPAPGRTSEER